MPKVNFVEMSTKQLVNWYNSNVSEDKMVKKFSDRKTAERRCSDLFVEEAEASSDEAPETTAIKQRPLMKSSLKLDRTIRCVTTKGVWKNAYQMWREHPEWMTSSQQDRLTAQLYKAAKNGEKLKVEINGRSFELVNVEGK